ncbi:uncharacterized protein LOC119690127 [Teleopsis dalmanni]|uniref:uncharacterized protein LOC119690127 n=1 Tax=Teleopsis dalmanni TaxID=139649 RepID=UPI0018CC8BCD|nr:uncharacterized protein LOC119690127 [Teleopsis dalmanni]
MRLTIITRKRSPIILDFDSNKTVYNLLEYLCNSTSIGGKPENYYLLLIGKILEYPIKLKYYSIDGNSMLVLLPKSKAKGKLSIHQYCCTSFESLPTNDDDLPCTSSEAKRREELKNASKEYMTQSLIEEYNLLSANVIKTNQNDNENKGTGLKHKHVLAPLSPLELLRSDIVSENRLKRKPIRVSPLAVTVDRPNNLSNSLLGLHSCAIDYSQKTSSNIQTIPSSLEMLSSNAGENRPIRFENMDYNIDTEATATYDECLAKLLEVMNYTRVDEIKDVLNKGFTSLDRAVEYLLDQSNQPTSHNETYLEHFPPIATVRPFTSIPTRQLSDPVYNRSQWHRSISSEDISTGHSSRKSWRNEEFMDCAREWHGSNSNGAEIWSKYKARHDQAFSLVKAHASAEWSLEDEFNYATDQLGIEINIVDDDNKENEFEPDESMSLEEIEAEAWCGEPEEEGAWGGHIETKIDLATTTIKKKIVRKKHGGDEFQNTNNAAHKEYEMDWKKKRNYSCSYHGNITPSSYDGANKNWREIFKSLEKDSDLNAEQERKIFRNKIIKGMTSKEKAEEGFMKLSFLRNEPFFVNLTFILKTRPNLLQSIFTKVPKNKKINLLDIVQNDRELNKLLTEIQNIQFFDTLLTEKDYMAIAKIATFGFPHDAIIFIYVMCECDEENALLLLETFDRLYGSESDEEECENEEGEVEDGNEGEEIFEMEANFGTEQNLEIKKNFNAEKCNNKDTDVEDDKDENRNEKKDEQNYTD